ncbi:Chromatin-remodeling ATPase INO80 [Plasmodiophora brassicae]
MTGGQKVRAALPASSSSMGTLVAPQADDGGPGPVAGVFDETLTFDELHRLMAGSTRVNASRVKRAAVQDPLAALLESTPREVFTFDESACNTDSLTWFRGARLSDCTDPDLLSSVDGPVHPQPVSALLDSYRARHACAVPDQPVEPVLPSPTVQAPSGESLPAADTEFDAPPAAPNRTCDMFAPESLHFFDEISPNAKRRKLSEPSAALFRSSTSDTEPEENIVSLAHDGILHGRHIWVPKDPTQCRFVLADDGFDEAPADFHDVVVIGEEDALLDEDEDAGSDPSKRISRADRRRAQLWNNIVRHEMVREHRKYQARLLGSVNHFRRVSFIVVKEVRRLALRAHRLGRDVATRAKRCTRDMQAYWRRMEKELVERKKSREKEELERLKALEEAREAAQQQRKLEFLLTQTELFSHFIGKKMGFIPDAATPGNAPGSTASTAHVSQVDAELQEEAEAATKRYIQQTRDRASTFDPVANGAPSETEPVLEDQEVDLLNPSTMPTNSHLWSEPTMFKGRLKEYQVRGVNWLINLYEQGINGILADEMGLGKTIQAICLLAHLAEVKNIWGPFLVVAPNSTLHQWKQELNKFCPLLTVIPYWGTQKDRTTIRKFWKPKALSQKDSPFHVCVTSYSTFVNDEKHFQRIKWQYMVLDEAQAIKNANSQRWMRLLNLKCRNRLLLTGTPIQNSMAELWALLHFIMPTLFDSHEEFNEWFSKDVENAATGGDKDRIDAHKLKRLHMILQPFMLRRVKSDVEHEMPKKTEIHLSCNLSQRQRTLYRALQNKISFADLGDTSLMSKENLMNLVMQFRKVCNHPEVFERSWAHSPFQFTFDSYVPSASTTGGGRGVGATPSIDAVIPTAHNPVALRVPRCVLNLVSSAAVSPKRSLWHPSYIAGSSSFSFHRLIDASPSEVAFAFWSQRSPLHAWLAIVAIRHLLQRLDPPSSWYGDVDDGVERDALGFAKRTSSAWRIRDRLMIRHRCASSAPFEAMSSATISTLSHLVRALPILRVPDDRVAAAPQEMIVSCRRTFVRMCDGAHSGWERTVLTGVDCRPWCPDPASRCRNDGLLLPGLAMPSRYADAVGPAALASCQHTMVVKGLCRPLFDAVGSNRSQVFAPHPGKLIADSGKLMVLDRLLAKLKAEGHRVLIFSQMKKMIDILEDYMHYRKYSLFRLDGGTDLADRRDMVNDFQANDDTFAFLLSTRAGGLGITLTAADTVIFFDSDWNNTMDAQAQDRVHRIGQTKPVTVYRLVCTGTVEERILKRAQEKFEIQKMVYSGQFKLQKDVDLFKKSELKDFLRDTI